MKDQVYKLAPFWGLLGCIIAFSYSAILAESLTIKFYAESCFPLVTAWLAIRLRAGIFHYALFYGIITVFTFSHTLDFGGMYGSIYLGLSTKSYFAGLLTFCAFTNREQCRVVLFLQPWWKWALWIALIVSVLAAFLELSWSVKANDFFTWSWQNEIIFTLLLAVPVLNWRYVTAQTLPKLPQIYKHPILSIFTVAAICILTPALFGHFNSAIYSTDEMLFSYSGFYSQYSWLLLTPFALTAFRLLNWRPLLLVLVLLFGIAKGTTVFFFIFRISPGSKKVLMVPVL